MTLIEEIYFALLALKHDDGHEGLDHVIRLADKARGRERAMRNPHWCPEEMTHPPCEEARP